MANRSLLHARSLLALAALAGTVVAVPSIASATPGPHASPQSNPVASPRQAPSIPSVQKRLGKLALENDQLVEQYNQAKVALGKRTVAAAAAHKAAQAAAAKYDSAHQSFVHMVQAQYEGQQSFGAASALLTSDSGANYLDRLSTLNVVTRQSAGVVTSMTRSRNAANTAEKTAYAQLVAAKRQAKALEVKRSATQKQINKYRGLLSTLTAAQRAAYQDHGQVKTGSLTHLTSATSGAARRAVEFALRQVGKPYVFGAAGPGAYDCSGLTMAAWQQGGVSLPHSAADQYNYGHHVGRNDLEPGDLIFFYQPIGHVTIYIGDGLMVSAPTEGEPVQVVPVAQFNSDYVGATRLTG